MFRIKKLDSMLIKGFIPPFLMSFLIALFVLVMQTLWLHIDDIIGKGAGTLVILEIFILSFNFDDSTRITHWHPISRCIPIWKFR
ncbi:MAG: LptF/LptG family permease [Saprospiraceae bacterium]|nr:LptF/LptG family permease [Saprospiraceae bacterium]